MKTKTWLSLTAAIAGGVVGAVSALTYRQYQREIAVLRQRVLTGGTVLETAVGLQEYAETGSGPALLISHGAGGGYDQGLAVAELFGPGLRYLAPSRFGYLRTPLPADASPEAQADAFAALLDVLQIERTAMVGISAGGPAAIAFALRHPKRCTALILSVAATHALPSQPPFFEAFAEVGYRSDFAFWWLITRQPLFVARSTNLHPHLWARLSSIDQNLLIRILHTMLPISWRRVGMQNDVKVITGGRLDLPLEQVTQPTLILGTKDDPLLPFATLQRAAQRISHAQFIVADEGGHFGMIMQREALSAQVRALVAQSAP